MWNSLFRGHIQSADGSRSRPQLLITEWRLDAFLASRATLQFITNKLIRAMSHITGVRVMAFIGQYISSKVNSQAAMIPNSFVEAILSFYYITPNTLREA